MELETADWRWSAFRLHGVSCQARWREAKADMHGKTLFLVVLSVYDWPLRTVGATCDCELGTLTLSHNPRALLAWPQAHRHQAYP